MQFLGALFDAMLDPLTWLVIAVSLGIAVLHRPWWWAVIVAAVGAMVLAAIVGHKDASLDLASKPGMELLSQFVTILIWSQVAFWLTKAIIMTRGRSE